MPRLINRPIWLSYEYDRECSKLAERIESTLPYYKPPLRSFEPYLESPLREYAATAGFLQNATQNAELMTLNMGLQFSSDPELVRCILPGRLLGCIVMNDTELSPSEGEAPHTVLTILNPRHDDPDTWFQRFALFNEQQLAVVRAVIEQLRNRYDTRLEAEMALRAYWSRITTGAFAL